MFRYLGSILIVLMALVLTAAVGTILASSVAARLQARAIRMTPFDSIAAVGGPPPRLRVFVEDADAGSPYAPPWIVSRFEAGSTAWGWVSRRNGLGGMVGPTGLPYGTHAYAVGLPELHPRLDVGARGTIWVWLPETPVIWLDAEAIVPKAEGPAAAVRLPPGQTRDIADAMKTLAAGRQVVYLVVSDVPRYGSVRGRLRESGAPPGPAFWILPGRESSRLRGLKGVWRQVDAAVVCSARLARGAAAATVPCWQVPPAGPGADWSDVVRAWRDVQEHVPARP